MRLSQWTLCLYVLPFIVSIASARPPLTVPCATSLSKDGILNIKPLSDPKFAADEQEIAFADLWFEEDDLPVGTEIELWPHQEEDTLFVQEGGRNIWITDERTGSLIRFDVTSIVRAWQDGTLSNEGFDIAVTGSSLGNGFASAQPELKPARSLNLVCYFVPRLPKPSHPSTEHRGRPGYNVLDGRH